MRMIVVILAAWAGVLSGVGSEVQAQQVPPVPAPSLPSSPSVELPRPLPLPMPRSDEHPNGGNGENAETPKPKPKPPKISLREKEKQERRPQGQWGASEVMGNEANVSVSGATLTAKLTGTAVAYHAVLCPGTGLASIRLTQPFEIEPGEGASPWVSVTLSGRVEGYARTVAPATAGMRLASVTVHPCGGGGPPLALALPPAGTADGHHFHYQQEAALPSVTLPAGQYVLVMDFAVEASVSGLFHGDAWAVFSAAPTGTEPIGVKNPYSDLDTGNFGFTAVLKAEALGVEPAE